MLRKVSSRLFLFSDPSLRASGRYGPISDAIVHYWTLPSRGGGEGRGGSRRGRDHFN